MPSVYATNANSIAGVKGTVEHSPEEGLKYMRLFNQGEVFGGSSAGGAAVAEGVCFGCSRFKVLSGGFYVAAIGG